MFSCGVRVLRKAVKRATPARVQPQLLTLYLRALAPFYAGDGLVCPCCDTTLRAFPTYGVGRHTDHICPRCGSLRRHRLLILYLRERTTLFEAPNSVLHIAPEAVIQRILRAEPGIDYTSIDLASPIAMERMDITELRFADARFDAIICLHVLEHVPDDRAAMTELFRVLKPGGWAILETPLDLSLAETEEDPSVVSPRERERLYGQPDHVRRYGRDYLERLADVGFSVALDPYPVELPESAIARYGLNQWNRGMVVCTRPAAVPGS